MNIQIISHTTKPSESLQRLLKELGENPVTLHYGCGVDKLTQYQYFLDKDLPHPKWTINKNIAQGWLDEDTIVLARERIKSQTGTGILVVKPGEELPDAKVYTQYKKKKREFRVNIFKDIVINLREKLKVGIGASFIRNQANGYTTGHCKPMSDGLEKRLRDLALAARGVSQSDFVGVDIAHNEFYDEVFLLEVNSGPSIEGSSVKDFAKAITNYANH